MIPLRLVLKNFLSYREATLDFAGLHTACICGANGAGKSSLLEAIGWAIWGESRASSEDDIIHLGVTETQVDFTFIHHQHTYRILRSRYRGQATSLEFQIAEDARHETREQKAEGKRQKDESKNASFILHPSSFIASPSLRFRSLTAKGVRATQQLILDHLRLDYETFVNSAYLRQGRADEFMLKRPGERKQILADLLKLNQYDELAERSKDQARGLKAQVELLERTLAEHQQQLQQRETIAQERTVLEATLAQTQQQQTIETEQLQGLQASQHQRQTWQQQLTWQQQQQRMLEQDCHRLQQELAAAQQQQQELESLLQQEAAIVAGYNHFQSLQAQEAQFSARFKAAQQAQTERQQYLQQQNEQVAQLQTGLQQTQAQLEALEQQKHEIGNTLKKAASVEEALKSLQQARSQLSQLDQLQLQASPLLQRQQQLQTQLQRSQAQTSARLDQLSASAHQLRSQQERQSHLHIAVVEVSDRIETLEQRRAYREQVRERGLERRSFMERLQSDQRNCEMQLADVEQKIGLLKEAQGTGYEKGAEGELQTARPAPPSYPPCPLCDRSLDEHHWQLVLKKHQDKQQEILDQIWTIREQLAASEREIQILRQEYREVDQDLNHYPTVLERRGQLQEQLQAVIGAQQTLEQMAAEMTQIERSLQTGEYAVELHQELRLLEQRLQTLNYDERNHALARGEVDRWRWAEIKQAEIKQAQRSQAQIARRQPKLQEHYTQLQSQLEQLNEEIGQQLQKRDRRIAEIGYDLDQHNNLRTSVQRSQIWQLRYQELRRAQQQYPQIQQRTGELYSSLQERKQALKNAQEHMLALVQNLQSAPDCQHQIVELDQQLHHRRLQLDEQLAALGRLQQQQQQLETLDAGCAALEVQLQALRRQYRVYHELAQAFGKNGIQALMIENVLPQLEAETNRILARLSANQLHIQFITQRSHRRNPSRSKAKLEAAKLIETLDILIADAQGTRPYETYSGGEAFRVNFAIRLALARLLAQRSGTALQMLIVDEGFGTQDAEGCERLVAAINAIASDFACILTVTHVPHFKEAFQARIEVLKTEAGSQIQLIV